MNTWLVFLRAVNVGGTGKLPMKDLRKICEELGFANVRTYIASGNLALESKFSKTAVQEALHDRLTAHMNKDVGILVISSKELGEIVNGSPYAQEDPSKSIAVLLPRKPSADAIDQAKHRKDEQIAIGRRALYVYYPSGMGRSRLSIPAAATGTARNLNTLRKMLEIAGP